MNAPLGGELIIILLSSIGLAVTAGVVVAVVLLLVRNGTRVRDIERRVQRLEGELKELRAGSPQ